jgi:hypothetical protein
MYKTVLILANSIKHKGHCVAGKELATNTWIRFVGDENGKELSKEQIKYTNSYGEYSTTPLKVLKVEVSKKCALSHQPENYLITGSKWEQVNPYKYDCITSGLLDTPINLWGITDSVADSDISGKKIVITQSLYLVKVSNLITDCQLDANDKKKRRIRFTYGGVNYNLAVTDPKFDEIHAGKVHHNSILCISLGELFEATNKHYKIIAGVY